MILKQSRSFKTLEVTEAVGDIKVWKIKTKISKWPEKEFSPLFTVLLPWWNNDDNEVEDGGLVIKFHVGRDQLKPTLTIDSKMEVAMRLRVKLQIVSQKNGAILETIPGSGVDQPPHLDLLIDKLGGFYPLYTRWNNLKINDSVYILITVSGHKSLVFINETMTKIRAHEQICSERQSPPKKKTVPDNSSSISKNVLSDLKSELWSQDLSDLTIIAADKVSFRCNRTVLALRSPMLRKMLTGNSAGMMEQRSNVIEWPYKSKVIKELIKFAYVDNMSQNLGADTLCELISVAHMYELPSLVGLCIEALWDLMNAGEPIVSQVLILVHLHGRENDIFKEMLKFAQFHLYQMAHEEFWPVLKSEIGLFEELQNATLGDPEWSLIRKYIP
jgi:hypothetical protein